MYSILFFYTNAMIELINPTSGLYGKKDVYTLNTKFKGFNEMLLHYWIPIIGISTSCTVVYINRQ